MAVRADGRTTLESKTHPSGQATLSQSTRYHYDAAGRITGYEQHNGAGQRISQATYQLDALGRTSEETLSYGQGSSAISASLAQSWNADGQKTSQTYPDGSTAHYQYEQGLLKTASPPASQGSNPGNPGSPAAITWQSYAWNQPSAIQYPGITRHNHYDGFWRYQRIHASRADSTNPANPTNPNTPSLLELSYQYDQDSNITHIQRQAGGDIQGSTDYRYDRLDRLIQASPSLSLQELGLPHEHYSYDAVHNRTASAHQPGVWQYASGNRLTQWGQQQQATSYQYNHSGHITQKTQGGTNNPGNPGSPNASTTSTTTTTSYHYDAAQRLVHIEQNGQTIARYHYDPKGRRIAKTTIRDNNQSTTTWYVYAEEGLIAEINEQGQTRKSYGWEPDSPWGTKILWQADHGSAATKTYHYIHSDHLGTPQIATDKNGNTTWAQVSEAFGKATISANASTEINIRFPGQYYDKETGTHYNFHRDYDPSTGRYLQSDPVGLDGGINVYAYSKQNPLVLFDPNGAIPIPIVLAPPDLPPGYGCGDASTDAYVPDAYIGYDFSYPCRIHDICYGTCGNPKEKCDDDFLTNMLSVCHLSALTPPFLSFKLLECITVAHLYYAAVALFGKDAYCAAQKAACPDCTEIPGC